MRSAMFFFYISYAFDFFLRFLRVLPSFVCLFLQYVPVPEGFTKGADGSIVLRRIMCNIINASFKYGKFPTLPLPLRAKGGYLDFLYLDQDMRITRGNRGGLFIHFRPEFLDQQF
jgi:hypothetical protein